MLKKLIEVTEAVEYIFYFISKGGRIDIFLYAHLSMLHERLVPCLLIAADEICA
jgi:hypothetical protein